MQEEYASEPEAWFIRRGSHIVRLGCHAQRSIPCMPRDAQTRGSRQSAPSRRMAPGVFVTSACRLLPFAPRPRPYRDGSCRASPAERRRALLCGVAALRPPINCTQALEVADFEGAERRLRRHGVE